MTPQSIKASLDQYVIGQDDVKKSLAALAFYYMQSLETQAVNSSAKISKSNMLIIGDTGCGKTLLLKSLSEVLQIPFASVDATSLTSAGYKGSNVDTIFTPFVAAAQNGNPKVPGIVFIDEIDKMVIKDPGQAAGLQNEFLKIIEGSEVFIETSPYKGVGRVKIDTSNMMFVFSGSFARLEEIITARLGAAPEKPLKVLQADLEHFGLSREFTGRISVIRSMEKLNQAMLVKIFTEPRNSISRQYQDKLGQMGIHLEFTPAAVTAIAQKALAVGVGARALAQVTSEIMDNILYDAPSMNNVAKITITDDTVRAGIPKITHGQNLTGGASQRYIDDGKGRIRQYITPTGFVGSVIKKRSVPYYVGDNDYVGDDSPSSITMDDDSFERDR